MPDLLERVKFLNVYLSPKGRGELAEVVQLWRREYGDRWLAEFTNANPDLSIMISLIANHEFPEAFERLKDHVDEWVDAEPNDTFFDKAKRIAMRASARALVDEYRPNIELLYTAVRTEIDRPRF